MTLQVIALIAGVVGVGVILLVGLKWWAEGTASGFEVAMVTIVYGGLIFGLCVSVGRPFAMTVTLILLLAAVGWMIYQNKQTGLKSYYKEKIRNYEHVIRMDPSNTAARTAMAEAYYAIGDLDRAIGSIETVSEQGKLGTREAHRLRDWREQREMRDSKTILCRNCYTRNLWGATQCRVCSHSIIYNRRPWWEDFVHDKTNVRILIGVIFCLIVWGLAASLLPMLEAGIIVGCVTLTVAGWLLLSSKS